MDTGAGAVTGGEGAVAELESDSEEEDMMILCGLEEGWVMELGRRWQQF